MRQLFIILFLLISSLASGTNYYVKNGGNDGAAGTSDGTAWATIAKVNSYGTSPGYSPGDSILFKCGDTWRITTASGYLDVKSGTSGGHVIYSNYGAGSKPIIMGSVSASSTDDWTNISGNIWRNSDVIFVKGEVGNLILNGTTAGHRVFTTPDAQGKFYYHTTLYYVDLYSVGNPATYYTTIECGLNVYPGLIYVSGSCDYVTIDGFDLRYGAWLGISMSSGAGNISIRNNDITWIGGATASSSTTLRLGNGIQLWGNGNDILIENNYVAQCFDTGITAQFGDPATISNFKVHNNILYRNSSALEFWWVTTGGSINGLYVENNTCVESGYGWSQAQKTSNLMGWDIYLSSFPSSISNWYIRNNIFSGALRYTIRGTTTPQNAVATQITWDYNLYHKSGDIAWLGGNYYTFTEWKTYSGDDAHSISDNPDFTSSTDFHLTEPSPAIDAGLGIGISYDYDWNLRDANPDIGAYEYDATEPDPPPPILPTVTTSSVTINFSALTASGGGNVTDDGEGTVTVRGVCWNTSANPTTSHSKTEDGSGTGAFSSTLTDLAKGVKYYVRAYATNEVGTAYGNNVSFTMSEGSMVFYGGKPVFYAGKPVFFGGTASANTLLDQLTYYWQCDETEGSTGEDEMGVNDLSLTNVTVNQTGIVGKAHDYNGTTSKATFAISPTAGRSEFSISVWVYPHSIAADRPIWSENYSSSDYWQCVINLGYWYTRDESTGTTGARNNDLAMPTLTINDWNHLVFNYSVTGGYKRIYLNGELEAESTTSIDVLTSARTDIELGFEDDQNDWWDGLMDEIMFYTRPLTATEIASLYNEGNGYQPL